MTGSSIKRGWNSNFQHQTIKMWRKGIEVNLTAAVHLSQILCLILKNPMEQHYQYSIYLWRVRT